MSGRSIRATVAGLAGVIVVISGCSRTVDQEAISGPQSSEQVLVQTSVVASATAAPFEELDLVGGQPITDEPSGLRPDAPTEVRPVTNSDGGEIDRLAALAMADIEEFWARAYGPPLSGKFTPVADLFSWDSTDQNPNGKFCGAETADYVNAAMCYGESDNCTTDGVCSSSYNTIGWDRAVMLPSEQRAFGDSAVAIATLGHEVGHAIQYVMSDLKPRRSIVAEQQADCFSGVYARWVTDGKSPRFTLNTGEGLDKVVADVLGVGDPVATEEDRRQGMGVGEHGSAFERVSAFEMGFNDGTAACAGIDENEISQRRGGLPLALQSGESGENPVTEKSVATLVEGLDTIFTSTEPPALSFDQPSCPGVTDVVPAVYCPSNNTLYANPPGLARLSTSISGEAGYKLNYLPQFGDYTAYSVLVSRYTLAVQHRQGLTLTGEQAGLRSACLTGVATARLAEPVPVSGGQTIKLTAGDLDEAVAGVLVNGLLAADVNGDFAPKGFARVAAFRAGVLGDEKTCLTTFG